MSAPAGSAGPLPAPVAFPRPEELARAFFGEAVRHLGDARVLHQAARYPGAITSAMKAAELGTKAVLIVDGSLGWWKELLQTHKPLNEIETHDVLKHQYASLERYSKQYDPGLIGDVKALEKLAPARLNQKSFSFETQANTEYPFFYLSPGPAGGPTTGNLRGPSQHFTDSHSREHYLTARRLLTAYRALYAPVRAWNHRLPRTL
jgi:hypothetical protein